jgi:hypothetical protein
MLALVLKAEDEDVVVERLKGWSTSGMYGLPHSSLLEL